MRIRVGRFMIEATFFLPPPPLSVNEQLALLQRRGLIIPDPLAAHHFLQTVGYYRF
jgi:abortive infection bacteriophage resistance protein